MGEVQTSVTPNDIATEAKRALAGLNEPRGSSAPRPTKRPAPRKKTSTSRSSFKPSMWKPDEAKKKSRKKSSGSGGGSKRKYDENKHKRDAEGQFSKTEGRGSKKKDPNDLGSDFSVRMGDGMTKNKQNAEKIKKVQTALIKAGLLSTKGGGSDGKAGPLTTAAIKRWQKKSGYKPTGAMGPLQIRELMSGKKGLAGKEFKRKKELAAQKKRTAGKPQAFVRSDSAAKKTPKTKPKSGEMKRYDPDKAEMQRLEALARRNEQMARLVDMLFGSETSGTKSLQTTMETKVRRVRTPAGESHFDQPIGTIIVADLPLSFLRIGKSDFDGWDRVDGQDGGTYYVGQFDGEKGFVATDVNDNVVLEADSMDDLYKSLDRKVGASLDPKTPGDLTRVATDVPGWSKQRGGNGDFYYVGRFEGEKGYVATDVDDNVLVEGKTIKEVNARLKEYDAMKGGTTGGSLDALFRKPGFEMKKEIAAMSSDERRELLRNAREQKKGDKKFIFLADAIRKAGEGHTLTGRELLSAWKATTVQQEWTDRDLKNVSNFVNMQDFEEWHEDNSAKIAITNEVARRKTAERAKVNAAKTGELDVDNIGTLVKNGPSNMSDEERDKIREWAKTASKGDLRVAESAVGAMSHGDRRKASTARANTAIAILREQSRLNLNAERENERNQAAKQRAENHFARGGPMIEFAERLLANPEYADPNITGWDDLLKLSTQMSGVIGSYRDIGRVEEADKLLAMSIAATARRDQVQREVDEYLNANADGRKRLSMKFEALDPTDQSQFLGVLGVTFVSGDRANDRKGELEAIIRNKNVNAVNLNPIKTALQRYVIQSQKNSNPEGSRQRFTEGLEDLIEAGDVYSLYRLLDMLEKTKGNDRATPAMIARMEEMIPLVKNGIETAEDAREKRN